MPNEKPVDYLERFAEREFADSSQSVDVASVSKDAKPADLLFGKGKSADGTPPEDEGDDTFLWDESPETVQKYGQGMWRTDVQAGAKTFRYWGKTRTEVTKALKKAQAHATEMIEQQKAKIVEISTAQPKASPVPVNLTPDTKLPFDPIPRKNPRVLDAAEIARLQELEQTDPILAWKIKMEALTGYTPEALAEIATRNDNLNAKRIADEAAFNFQANHTDDWEPTPGNTALMDRYLKERNWPVTANNLEIAFSDLRAQNRLAMPKVEEEVPVTPVAATAPPVEEVPPPPPPVSIPAASARGAAVKTDADRLREDVATLQTAPLDRARELLVDGFRRARSGR